MAKVVTPMTCRIQVIGTLKESKYQAGQYYRSCLFVDLGKPETDPTSNFWKSLSDVESDKITQDCLVQLFEVGTDKSGKPKHNLILVDSQATTAAPTTQKHGEWTNEYKREIAAKVDRHADLLRYCLQMSREKFGGLIESEESFRALATTLFLSVTK